MSKLESLSNLLKSCFLPELKSDLDGVPIYSDHFIEYFKIVELQVPLLYDFVQQQDIWSRKDGDDDTIEIRAELLLLMCELTASDTIYKISNGHLLNNANRLLQKYNNLDEPAEEHIFKYYQQKLNKSCWKRQLGAVHGFLRFMQWRFRRHNKEICTKMSNNWLNFCLSVGLNTRECSVATYKEISTKIFLITLEFGEASEIRKLNIHSVIYDTVFKDAYCMESIETTTDIWNCLCLCLDYFDDIDILSWNQADDMLDKLINNVILAPDKFSSIILIKFIIKLCTIFTINRAEFDEKLNTDITTVSALNACRIICSENTSYTSFRWAKSLLNMFILESHKLLQSENKCEELILDLHKCYMASILAIPLEIFHPHLCPFFEKFIAVLIEAIVVHKQNKLIIQLVKDFLETFNFQLNRSMYTKQNTNLNRCYLAIDKLKQNDYFL